MKLLIVVLAAFAIGTSEAGLFSQLASSLSTIASTIVNLGKNTLSSLTGNLLGGGSNILTTALSTLATSALGKRDTRGLIDSATSILSGGQALIGQLIAQVNGIASSGLEQIGALVGNALEHPIETVQHQISSVVSTAHNLLSNVVGSIPSKVEQLAGSLAIGRKRAIADTLASIGTQITALFNPAVKHIQQTLSTVGQAAKGVVGAIAGNFNDLGSKLTGHVSALHDHMAAIAHHGTNALAAIKDSVTDIWAQTMLNVKPHLAGALHEAAGAATDTLGTVGQAISQKG